MRILLFFTLLLFTTVCSAQSVMAVQKERQGYQFVNKQTKAPVNNLFWEEAEPFVHGFSRVLKNDHFSFVDTNGNPICETQLEVARNFSNKLAAVKNSEGWGFINETGKIAIPYQYDIAFDFTETVTVVFKNKKWFLINSNGNVLKQLNITTFYGFNNGVAKIDKDGIAGTMNLLGETVFEKVLIKPTTLSNTFNQRITGNETSVCPDNIDFEYGSFFNWKCYTGKVDSVGNTNVITVVPSVPTVNRHTIYNRIMPSPLDPYGLFPVNPPDGSNFAVRLGNTNIGAQAERIQYKLHVPTNDSNFSIKYDYAVVFEDPGHTNWTQPRFTARLLDSATNTYVECASFEYISTSNLPGFNRSTVDPGVVYKTWAPVFVSLRGYAGKTMYLEFTTADCVRKGHWGYAYVDIEKPCGKSIQVQYDCTSPNITHLAAPPGFQTYNWWNADYTVLLGTGMNVILNPGPQVNSTIWLEMIPYSNFGCKDTLPVRITGVFNADFSLSDTTAVCAPHSFTFYNSNVPSTLATWNFGDGSFATGDTVTHTYMLPGNYLVTLDVVLPSGCRGTIQKDVSVLQPVGSFYFNGEYFCNSQQVRFDAVVNGTDSLFWDFGDGIILSTTQTTVYHSYALPGLYIPYLTVQSSFGCQNTLPGPDTIRIEKLRAGFSDGQIKRCGNTRLNVTDTSYSFFGINTHAWDFGDGSTASGANASHIYTATGTYIVQLVITGISGCTDTIKKPVYIKVNNNPVAAITGSTSTCQSDAVTFTGNISSIDPIGTLQWIASNGDTGSGNSIIINFSQPGNYNIQLIAVTVNNCYDTAIHNIVIKPTPDVNLPDDQELCAGTLTTPINFTGAVNGTVYSWTNSNPSIGLASSGSGNIAAFTTINNTGTSVVATITVSTAANGCPGPSKSFNIKVNPTAAINQPVNQELCNNAATDSIIFTSSISTANYNWTNNNPSIGLAATGSGDIPSFTATNTTTSPITATIIVSANGCSSPTKVFTITVNPTPDVFKPLDQELCSGASTVSINFTGTLNGTAYNWVNNTASIGLAANGSGNIGSFTTINNTNTITTATITVSPTAYGCSGAPKSFNITVYPIAEISQPVNQQLCKNAPSNPVIFTGTVSGATYSWTNNNTLIGLAATGTGDIPSFSAINNTTQPVTATITIIAELNGCPGPSKTFTITVNPMPAVTDPVNQVACNGTTISTIHFATAVSGALVAWTNDNPSIGLPANGLGDIPTFTAINNSNQPIVSTITVAASANGCPGTAKIFTITINPTANVLQPVNQNLCNGALSNITVFGSSVNGSSFNWTNNNPSIGLAVSGTGDMPAFTGINNSNADTTATITVLATANSCAGPSKTFTITIKPTANITQPANQVLCNGAPSNIINFVGTVPGTSFNWTNSNTSIGLNTSGIGSIPSFTASNTTADIVTSIITVTPISNGCPGLAKTFTIKVNPTPNILQPGDVVVCNGTTTNHISFNGLINGTRYNWVNSNPTIGLGSNGLGNIPPFIAINNDTSAIIATIIVTPSLNSCPGSPKTFSITINPSPVIAALANQSLCNKSITDTISLTGSLNATVYSWTNNNPSIGLAATGTGDINAFIGINNGSSPINAIITVSADAYGCTGRVKTLNITVNPTPTVSAGNNINICEGRTTQLLATGAAHYSWSPANNLSCTNCSNPVTNVNDSAIYVVTGTSAYGCKASDSVSLSIIRPFNMRIAPGDTLCVGESTPLRAMDAASYEWSPSVNLNNAHIAEPTATPSVTTNYRVIGYDAYNCFQDTAYVLINVGPKPTVDIGTDINTTTGSVITLHPTIQNGPIVSYLWTPGTDLSCTDCETPTATIRDNTAYTVTVKNIYGCIASDVMRVTVFCLDGQVFIPNAFTPDGNGLNDILMIRGKGIRVKSFRIFNRWGEVVFERTNFNPNDPKFGWDGKVRGVPASPDVFVYTAEVVCDNNVIYTYKGNTTILK